MLSAKAVMSHLRSPSRSANAPTPSPAYAAYLHAVKRRSQSIQLWQIGLVAALLIVWEVAPRVGWINPMLTSYPSAIGRTLIAMIQDGSLVKHTMVTLSEIIFGFAGGMLLGTLSAVVLWWSPYIYRVLDPFVVVINAIPKIALVPIFYIWLGDVASIYAMAIAISVFVTILMLYTGFQGIDPDKIKLVKLFGASRLKVLTKVVLPGNTTLVSTLRRDAPNSLTSLILSGSMP